jgi:G6PDH family F420-dependent oxidoreductase
VIAQAAATAAVQLNGRFSLGVGSGEALNEHILGDAWPETNERLDMLEEALDLIKQLWEGGDQTFRGAYYTVENARIYTLPDDPPPIAVAANKPLTAQLAGREGDAFIGVAPDADLVREFEEAGGRGKPRYGKVTCCWAEDEREAKETAHRVWPNAGIPGELSQELPLPRHFEQAAENVTADDVAKRVVCGPDVDRYAEQIDAYEQAGYDHVYLHQVGPDQQGFLRFAERELLPQY